MIGEVNSQDSNSITWSRQTSYGIKCKPIKVRNPQANAIVEHVHQVIGNMIRKYELEDIYLDENDPWGGILSATAFAV